MIATEGSTNQHSPRLLLGLSVCCPLPMSHYEFVSPQLDLRFIPFYPSYVLVIALGRYNSRVRA
jgi:hypothetical protein